MIVKAEVKYKVIFQSKYEGHSSQIKQKHVLSTAIRFFWFWQDIQFFREKKTFKTFLVEIRVTRFKGLMWQICLQ